MKRVSFVTATPTQATGQLPTAMGIFVPSLRVLGFHLPLAHAMAAFFAQSRPMMTAKNGCTLDPLTALAASATEASHFAHGRRGAFSPRTRGLAQHDV
jgi:hypothetical protein